MTDNIADDCTDVWMELCSREGRRRWFHSWNSLKQLWCNLFYIKGKKKTGYRSRFSLLLIMNALIVQSVANCT